MSVIQLYRTCPHRGEDVRTASLDAEPWDERSSGLSVERVRPGLFAYACRRARREGRISEALYSSFSILHNTGLAKGCFLTNSGSVLFSEANDPFVTCRLFSNHRHDELIDADCFSTPYVHAFEGALHFILRNLRSAFGILCKGALSSAGQLRSLFESVLAHVFLTRSYERDSPTRISMEPGRIFISVPCEMLSARSAFACQGERTASYADTPFSAGVIEGFPLPENALLVQNAYRFGFFDGGSLDRSLLARQCLEQGFHLNVEEGPHEVGLILSRP